MSTELSLAKTLLKFVPDMELQPGQYIYCTDCNRAFYDIRDNIRIEVDLVIVAVITVDDITDRVDKRVYYMEPARRFVVWDDDHHEFRTLNTSTDADAVYGSYGMVPFTMRSQVTGMNLAPRTLASAVYTSTGESVEALIANSYRLGYKTISIVAPYDGYNMMQIPYPFQDYVQPGNVMELYHNGLRLNEDKDYVVEGLALRILDQHYVYAGDTLTFIFTYNSTNVSSSPQRQMVIEGGYITRHSIPTDRLESVTDSYTLGLSDTVATSKALTDAYTRVNERIDRLETDYKGSYYATAGGTSDIVTVVIPEMPPLQDGTEINVKLTKNLNNGAVLRLNTDENRPIFVNGTRTTGVYRAGELITLVYNLDINAFLVKLYGDYKITTYYYHTRAQGNESIIQFAIPKYVPGITTLRVYQNNLRLFDTINYTVKDNAIRLLEYTAEAGDIFSFEVDVVEKYCL